jgi:predicted alpha/beta superfamily hydrolase
LLTQKAQNVTLHQIEYDWPDSLALVNQQKRRVWVWLPNDYAETQQDFSVLFMHDGQNVFQDSDATYGTCWSMVEAQTHQEQPMIVVAVEGQNNGTKRFDEFSPWVNDQLHDWKSGEVSLAGGRADEYLRFLTSTIVPDIHQRFRCRVQPEHNYLGGSSMGGVVSLYAATLYEHVFSNYMAMSTATWFAHEALIDCLQGHEFKPSTKIYADIGTQETSNIEKSDFPSIYLTGNQQLFSLLSNKLQSAAFLSLIDEGAEHNEAAWAQRLPRALEWLAR